MKFFLSLLLISSFAFTAKAQTETDKILNKAYTQAAKEHKNVFVIFHASWCGWCKRLDASMNDETTKKYFDNNFVTVHLTVQESEDKKKEETPRAQTLMDKYNAGKAGLPFFLIFNPAGEKLADSFATDGNLGCPASETEVNDFVAILKKTSKLNSAEEAAIIKRFRQNAPVPAK